MSRHPQGLETLILDRKADRSYDELSRACGGNPTGKRLHQITSAGIKNFPDPETIKGLARGLNVTTVDVLLSIARSLDIPVGEPDGALVLQGAGNLPHTAQEALINLSHEFQDMYAHVPEDQKATAL